MSSVACLRLLVYLEPKLLGSGSRQELILVLVNYADQKTKINTNAMVNAIEVFAAQYQEDKNLYK